MAGNSLKESADTLHKVSVSTFITDGCPACLPAAGYRNGTEVNNQGSNGNYWSSSLNSSNSNNAYNLNFNSSNYDWNNNNRYNGHTVRPVSELAAPAPSSFCITPQQLLVDLYKAYRDARRHKRKRFYQLSFELDFEAELVALRDELVERRYTPAPSTCFIINDPKQREIFAAEFRDRVVHHLYYNYTCALFERTFIADSYSCRKKKGTHYGFKRLQHHIRSVSRNYTRPCFVLKVDVMGYFMHISRERLFGICKDTLLKMAERPSDYVTKRWCEKLDYSFLLYLSQVIIMNDPLKDCKIKGSAADWRGLPRNKSLFHSGCGQGLPIGNLTSQLFSNVYMNVFDQFVKRNMRGIGYGRYVDDAFFISPYKSELRDIVPVVSAFLRKALCLEIHPHKLFIREARYGVEFLGGYAKPHRSYIANRSLCRMKRKISLLPVDGEAHYLRASVNSFLGVLSHYASYRLRKSLFGALSFLLEFGRFNDSFSKFVYSKVASGQSVSCNPFAENKYYFRGVNCESINLL